MDALHHSKHHSHFNLEESLAFIEKINPEQTFLIHISHRMGLFEAINPSLPKNVQLAHDGLVVDLD